MTRIDLKSETGAATAEYAIATIVPMVRCSRVDNHIAATVPVPLYPLGDR